MPSFTFTPTGKHLLLQYIQYLCFYKLNVLQHRPFPIFTNFLEHKNTKQCAQNLKHISVQFPNRKWPIQEKRRTNKTTQENNQNLTMTDTQPHKFQKKIPKPIQRSLVCPSIYVILSVGRLSSLFPFRYKPNQDIL